MIKLLIPKMPTAADLLPYLQRIDEARWYTNFGQLERELRARLEKRYDAYVITVSSCTAGLELMYTHIRDELDETIALPSLTFPATALAAYRSGLYPIFEEVDPITWTHPAVAGFGRPETGDWLDAAAAFGAQKIIFPNQTAVFSLHATKMVGAGEGGYIVTHDKHLADKFRRQTNFGIDQGLGNGISREWGTNCKLSEYHAAVALASLDAFDEAAYLRLHDWYAEFLPKNVTQQSRPRGAYPIMAVKLPTNFYADWVMESMREQGIEARRWYWPPMHKHPLFNKWQAQAELPITKDLSHRLLGLPYHLFLTKSDVERVCGALDWVLTFDNAAPKPL